MVDDRQNLGLPGPGFPHGDVLLWPRASHVIRSTAQCLLALRESSPLVPADGIKGAHSDLEAVDAHIFHIIRRQKYLVTGCPDSPPLELGFGEEARPPDSLAIQSYNSANGTKAERVAIGSRSGLLAQILQCCLIGLGSFCQIT